MPLACSQSLILTYRFTVHVQRWMVLLLLTHILTEHSIRDGGRWPPLVELTDGDSKHRAVPLASQRVVDGHFPHKRNRDLNWAKDR
jgi:hypothetical protein